MNTHKKIFILRSSLHFSIGMFLKLPSVWFWGIKLDNIDDLKCKVLLPYNWRSKNPFKSIYFSAQAGAAELSTGLLILHILGKRKDISMLVVSANIAFHKKATSTISFVCKDGKEIETTLNQLVSSGDTTTLVLSSIGVDIMGDMVSEMQLTWSFKKR